MLQLPVLGLFLNPARSQADTQVFAWGDNLPPAPPEATNIVQIAGGDGHIVALRADGRVLAWGENDYSQTNVPPDITNAVRVAAGSTHSLALLDDGTLRFWGSIYTVGLTNPPPGVVANMFGLALGPSAQHVLSLRSDGIAVDWGSSNSYSHLDRVPATATNVVDASAASYHALVLREDGTLAAWGQFGSHGGITMPPVPPDATNVVAVSSGFNHDLALRADGSLVGWGGNTNEAVIPAAATNIVAIASGGYGRLVLRGDGQLLSWSVYGGPISGPSYVSNVVAIAATTAGDVALSASDGPPLLGRMPRNPVLLGTTARFRALAISTTPLSYQWMCAGTNLPGATNATLVLSNAQLGQSGPYTLMVSNAFGVVTNSDLSFPVQPFLLQACPQSQAVAGGTTATFGVTAVGQGPFRYQWQTNGTDWPGATNTTLVLSSVQLSQAGTYSVTVSNAYGTLTSPGALLTVVPLFITTQPLSQCTYVGGGVSLSVATSGKSPYSYQWQFCGTNLPAATKNPLVLTNFQFADAGLYSVVVTNAYGAVQSSNALVSVFPIQLTNQPQSQAAFLGQTVTFSVTARASVPLSYQWQFNDIELPGATGSSLVLSNCSYSASGTYRAIISSASATTNSTEALLTVAQVASFGRMTQASVPTGTSNLLAISAKRSQTLALRPDGTVVGWGGSSTVPQGLTGVAAFSAGTSHDLVLLGDGSVVGWGSNLYGQTNIPSGLTSALAVAAGEAFSMVLQSDGTPLVWGANDSGQTNMPPGLTNIVAVAAGYSHSLALRNDGTVIAWGENSDGQTNVPPGLSNVVAIAAGASHSMALTSNGLVQVWGYNGYGQTNVPPSATNVVAICGGFFHCVALRADGTVLAWGYYSDGETAVPGDLRNVVGVAAADFSTLALVADGTPGPSALLTTPHWGPGGFSVSLPTRSGKVYLLEYKDSPTDPTWTGLPLVAGRGGMLTLTDPTPTGSQRFYRVRQW